MVESLLHLCRKKAFGYNAISYRFFSLKHISKNLWIWHTRSGSWYMRLLLLLLWFVCSLLKRLSARVGARMNNYKWWEGGNVNPSKQICIILYLYNVGPTSKTLGRRCTNIIQLFCVCWDDPLNNYFTFSDIKILFHILVFRYAAKDRMTHVYTSVILPKSDINRIIFLIFSLLFYFEIRSYKCSYN